MCPACIKLDLFSIKQKGWEKSNKINKIDIKIGS